MSKMFQDLEQFSKDDVTEAIERNDPDELQLVSITLALSCQDQRLDEETCIMLTAHAHSKVRAHAVMSLGYLARRFRRLDEHRVKPIIEAALVDSDEYIRAHAKAAADEICQFLHWDIRGHVYGSGPDPAVLGADRRSRSEP